MHVNGFQDPIDEAHVFGVDLTADLGRSFQALRQMVAEWAPRPCPPDWCDDSPLRQVPDWM